MSSRYHLLLNDVQEHFVCSIKLRDSGSELIPLTRETTVNQSSIPLIYLGHPLGTNYTGWDSVTYPLDILEVDRFYPKSQRFLTEARQKIMSCSGA